MNQADAERAKGALGMCSAMFRSRGSRDDGLVGVDALQDARIALGQPDLNDLLTGCLRASGTSLNRVAIARKSTPTAAAEDVSVRLRRMALTDELGIGLGEAPYEEAEAAGTALARMKDEKVTLRPLDLFADGAVAARAFMVLLMALVEEVADAHGITTLAASQRLALEIEYVAEP